MKRFTKVMSMLLISGSVAFYSCSDNSSEPASDNAQASADKAQPSTAASEGIQFEDVQLTSPLNTESVAEGKKIYEMKCQACHKLTDEKLVGPGWKDVTKRRKPGWIMSMILNPDQMLDKPPDAQKLLEQCLVRMPNQNLSKEEARKVLEFQRSNDGEK